MIKIRVQISIHNDSDWVEKEILIDPSTQEELRQSIDNIVQSSVSASWGGLKEFCGIYLCSYPTAKKIAVIKTLRNAKPGLGLKEAKDIVESTPTSLLVDRNQVVACLEKLIHLGCQASPCNSDEFGVISVMTG